MLPLDVVCSTRHFGICKSVDNQAMNVDYDKRVQTISTIRKKRHNERSLLLFRVICSLKPSDDVKAYSYLFQQKYPMPLRSITIRSQKNKQNGRSKESPWKCAAMHICEKLHIFLLKWIGKIQNFPKTSQSHLHFAVRCCSAQCRIQTAQTHSQSNTQRFKCNIRNRFSDQFQPYLRTCIILAISPLLGCLGGRKNDRKKKTLYANAMK